MRYLSLPFSILLVSLELIYPNTPGWHRLGTAVGFLWFMMLTFIVISNMSLRDKVMARDPKGLWKAEELMKVSDTERGFYRACAALLSLLLIFCGHIVLGILLLLVLSLAGVTRGMVGEELAVVKGPASPK